MTVGLKFKKPIHKLPKLSDKLALPFAKVGIEVEVERWDRSQCPLLKWEGQEDHSLRNGREFTTRGGLVGQEIVEEVENICTYCVNRKYSEGYPRAGIHLHIDMTDMNDGSDTELLHAIAAYMLFEDAMFGFAGNWRKACGFCDPLLISQATLPASRGNARPLRLTGTGGSLSTELRSCHYP